MNMKNGKILLSFVLLFAALFGCQKETAPIDDASGNQSFVATVIRFSVGERSVELGAIRQETASENNNLCAGAGCGNSPAKDISDDWTVFSAGNLLSITRQDNAVDPAFRLSLLGTIDLVQGHLPANVANARITLHDYKGALIQPNDDPAYQTGTLSFEGSQDAVQLSVVSRTGNVINGTFSGVLKMNNGSVIEIRDGTFTAQLRGL